MPHLATGWPALCWRAYRPTEQACCHVSDCEGVMRRIGLLLIVLLLPIGTEASAGRLLLIVSVDWEGRILTEKNLVAMIEFRRTFPTLPLLHFLNAAYF